MIDGRWRIRDTGFMKTSLTESEIAHLASCASENAAVTVKDHFSAEFHSLFLATLSEKLDEAGLSAKEADAILARYPL